jgi:hypothetical protein
MECTQCRRGLAADEPAYILSRHWGKLQWCGRCIATDRFQGQVRWDRPVRCGGCGQPVWLSGAPSPASTCELRPAGLRQCGERRRRLRLESRPAPPSPRLCRLRDCVRARTG